MNLEVLARRLWERYTLDAIERRWGRPVMWQDLSTREQMRWHKVAEEAAEIMQRRWDRIAV